MDANGCQSCPVRGLTTWTKGGGKTTHKQVGGPGHLQSLDYDVAIFFAGADQIRECKKCRADFTRAFAIPELWWSKYCRRSNGYFGCEYSNSSEGSLKGIQTWCRFLVKYLSTETIYHWYKLNVFTAWDAETRRTVVLVFDLRPSVETILHRLLDNLDGEQIGQPFWVYTRLVEEVIDQQDRAVWAVRNLVRGTEKARTAPKRPRPDFPRLHDIARHAIHVSETLELGTIAVESILSQHRRVTGTSAGPGDGTDIANRLAFFHNLFRSLHTRSASNNARLQNEIQLAFNAVAQRDASVSVEIGRAAQVDGAAMRTMAFVMLVFLPATFVCAVFSTSFFDFDGETGVWAVSKEFWRFWAVSVPVTVVTTVVWGVLGRAFKPMPIGEEDEGGVTTKVETGLTQMLRERRRTMSSFMA